MWHLLILPFLLTTTGHPLQEQQSTEAKTELRNNNELHKSAEVLQNNTEVDRSTDSFLLLTKNIAEVESASAETHDITKLNNAKVQTNTEVASGNTEATVAEVIKNEAKVISNDTGVVKNDEKVTLYDIDENNVNITTEGIPDHILREWNAVAYIQNFKNAMLQYVVSQYNNLTFRETEEVKQILEDFLKNFASDLRDAVEHQNESTVDIQNIPDGVPDDTFAEIKQKLMAEFPDINENTANEIIFRLRKNLFDTRDKLDNVIRKSQKAHAEFALN